MVNVMQLIRVAARLACAALVLSSLSFLAGCACVDIESTWIGEGFAAQSLRQDGLVIGGVVDATSEADIATGKMRAAVFRERLREGDDGVPARDSEVLTQHLGSERYAALMDEYRSNGEVSTGSLAEIASCGIKERYILLARIVSNKVGKSESSEYDANAEEWKKEKSTERTVEVIAHVLDLDEGKTAWRALGRYSAKRSTSYQEEKDDRGLFEKIVGGIFGLDHGSEPDHPVAPPAKEALRPVFEALAKELKET